MTTSDLSSSDAVQLLSDGTPSVYDDLLRHARAEDCAPVWLAGADCRLGVMPVPDDPVGAIGAYDPYRVLAEWWPGPCPEGCTCLEPFLGELPELTRSGEEDRSTSPRTFREAAAMAEQAAAWGHLALVRVSRPADIPAVVGWGGACNYPHQDNVRLSAVLRSWEERFGAVLSVMTTSTLELSVAFPPTTQEEAELVASEHFAFCPDQVDPQNGVVYTPRSYGEKIRSATRWRFWWD
ncbi:uncharacterized protein DUF4253 [Actinomycetospora succinea]|uniref:Uncharacterized protein DUF4253 n=1 Tax=Actinomycetospora succinea TaxID=663603 RepID=A0A4R6VED4_9PSEU|nr:DUF4253 domain-containing protein [Actinomycetospora succinea]TDQ61173.1 uncharacterized protein DUF4253 [Actinomycetospora succinea]